MTKSFTRKMAALVVLAASLVIVHSAVAAKKPKENSESKAAKAHEEDTKLLQDTVIQLNQMSSAFNSHPKEKNRATKLVDSIEKFVERKLTTDERSFLTAEFSKLESLPQVEMNSKGIQVYAIVANAKKVVLTVEVVDAAKHLFKFGGKTYELRPERPLQESVQTILNGIKEENEEPEAAAAFNPNGRNS